MLRNQLYRIEDYQNRPVFCSFLPGIAGTRGIPMWCYYLNRGQGIASFGVRDKEHPIMEFYPAHQAAQRTPLTGFRTFVKADGELKELFGFETGKKNMDIGMNSLEIGDRWEERGLDVRVEYETLPMEPCAALMRELSVTNSGRNTVRLEILDGLAELIPFGVSSTSMKEMGQTAKAWMEVLDLESKIPRFKVRASMEDSARVEQVKGSVFAMASRGEGLLPAAADKGRVFGYDTSMQRACGFAAAEGGSAAGEGQKTCNEVPCCYFYTEKVLEPGETVQIQELYGMAEEEGLIRGLAKRFLTPGWFKGKQEMAKALAEELTDAIACRTGDPVYDAYSRQTLLDNLLRGGYPQRIGEKELLYIYSRKHGDMERDYNFFSMDPEPYSQGNGNFRDVNQNRRCDPLFYPFVGDINVKRFYNAIQINGYNPLGVEKVTYITPDGREMTPGMIVREMCRENGGYADETELAKRLAACTRKDGYQYIEGYWSDHWTYNLDLLESCLAVWPDREEDMLFGDRSYTYRQAEQILLPRRQRYQETPAGIRQYRFLKENERCEKDSPLKSREGKIVYISLAEKILSLIIVKMSALDPYGIGIEMEGGKPGWYDALNGLPGLLGSSVAEACELERLIEFLSEKLQKRARSLKVPAELYRLAEAVKKGAFLWKEELEGDGSAVGFWTEINDAKERFWEETAEGVSGEVQSLDSAQLISLLNVFDLVLTLGRRKSEKLSPAVPATYYYYEVTDYKKDENGLLPVSFKIHRTPDFLEGAVHLLKLKAAKPDRRTIYGKIRNSCLFDQKLNMYKVNASLSEASFELGRACAFTPGWLENESVWLHMEYKYLLELLKSGLYDEFAEDWHHCAVPFLDEKVYGRSVLENSSFIASSANPDPDIAGRGFVARLSGSTAEFLQIWQIMMFGRNPFTAEGEELRLDFAPFIPEYLIRGSKTVSARFLGSADVVYSLPDEKTLIPGEYRCESVQIEWKDGKTVRMQTIRGNDAERIRNGEAKRIEVQLRR